MSTVSKAIDLVAIVKFFYNDKQTKNSIITKSFGKIGVVDSTKVYDPQPKSNEFWKVRIVRETKPGKNEGCFILEPLEKVAIEDLGKLLPGMYSEEVFKFDHRVDDETIKTTGLLIMRPHSIEHSWILPLKFKQSIMFTGDDIKERKREEEIYAIVVDLSPQKESE